MKTFLIAVIAVVVVGGVAYFSLNKSDAPAPQRDISQAKETLLTYFNLLKTKQYALAEAYHGSGYEILQNWNPETDPNDHATLLKNACEMNGLQCLGIKNVLSEEEISPSEFKFVVQFEKPEWSTGDEIVFTQGPCCGAEDTGERKTDFDYIVKKEADGGFVVTTPPVYVP